MSPAAKSIWKSIARDAFSSEGKSPRERAAMLVDLFATADVLQAQLTDTERARRARIADRLDPRPVPWWKNFRSEKLADPSCPTFSK
jgi:hypothetical protein